MASLVAYLQQMTASELMATQTMKSAQAEFRAAEEMLLDCERNLSNISTLPSGSCLVQSVGRRLWKISTSGRVSLELVVHLDEASGKSTRLSWRQVFKD